MTEPQITELLREILAVSRRNQELLEQLVGEQGDTTWTQPSVPAVRDSFGASPQIIDLIQRDKKIQAIKVYREQTGAGLAEAKQAVERLERELR